MNQTSRFARRLGTLRCENLVMKQRSTAVQACVKVVPRFKFTFRCWNTRFLESLWVKCGTASKAVKKWSQDEGNGNDFVMTSLRGGVFENKDFLNLASLGSWVIPKSCGFGRQDAGLYRHPTIPRLIFSSFQTTNQSSRDF